MCKKTRVKKVNLDWMHRPKNELEDVIEKIESNSNLKTDIDGKKIALRNLKDFLNDIVTGQINNKYDGEKEYLKQSTTMKNC